MSPTTPNKMEQSRHPSRPTSQPCDPHLSFLSGVTWRGRPAPGRLAINSTDLCGLLRLESLSVHTCGACGWKGCVRCRPSLKLEINRKDVDSCVSMGLNAWAAAAAKHKRDVYYLDSIKKPRGGRVMHSYFIQVKIHFSRLMDLGTRYYIAFAYFLRKI